MTTPYLFRLLFFCVLNIIRINTRYPKINRRRIVTHTLTLPAQHWVHILTCTTISYIISYYY
eukprot:gene5218-3736_t